MSQILIGAAGLREEGRTLIGGALERGLANFLEASPAFDTVRHGRNWRYSTPGIARAFRCPTMPVEVIYQASLPINLQGSGEASVTEKLTEVLRTKSNTRPKEWVVERIEHFGPDRRSCMRNGDRFLECDVPVPPTRRASSGIRMRCIPQSERWGGAPRCRIRPPDARTRRVVAVTRVSGQHGSTPATTFGRCPKPTVPATLLD